MRPRSAALWLTLVLRVSFGLVGALIVALEPHAELMRSIAAWTSLQLPPDGPAGLVLSPWQRWDALWYEHVAGSGYAANDGSLTFYPLYPALSRALSVVLGGQIVLAELAVTTIALGLALWALTRLAVLEIGDAVLTPLLIVAFPTGFFLLAPYTESLFLALSVGAFLALRLGRPWLAGALALAAGLARAQGVLLAIPLAVDAVGRMRRTHRFDPSVIAVAAPLLGTAALAWYANAQQRPLFSLQSLWGVRTVAPWTALADSVSHIARTGDPIELLNLLALVGAALLLVGWARMRLDLLLYAIASLLVIATRDLANLSPLMSGARYVLVVFPVFLAAARLLSRRPVLAAALIVVSACVEVALFSYWVRWGFVG